MGVAAKNLEMATALFTDLLGAEAGEEITVDLFRMKYQMCRIGKVDFELMAPIDGKGMIADFIEKRGEGLHHVAFADEDIENGIKVLRKKGVRFVTDKPLELHSETIDFSGNTVSGTGKFVFSHPSSQLGILFEFIQYPEGVDMS